MHMNVVFAYDYNTPRNETYLKIKKYNKEQKGDLKWQREEEYIHQSLKLKWF